MNEIVMLSNRIRRLSNWIRIHNEVKKEKQKLLKNFDEMNQIFYESILKDERIAQLQYENSKAHNLRLKEGRISAELKSRFITMAGTVIQNAGDVKDSIAYSEITPQEITNFEEDVKDLVSSLAEIKKEGGIEIEGSPDGDRGDYYFLNKVEKEVNLIRNEIAELNRNSPVNIEKPEFIRNSTKLSFV
jgi:hypothetical protein